MSGAAFAGKKIVISEHLQLVPVDEAEELARRAGADVRKRLTRSVDFLIVGGWYLESGGRLPRLLERAHRMREETGRPRLVDERVFLEGVGADEQARRHRHHYTLAQLGRILEVPPEVLRRWLRKGLIPPVRVVNRLPWFDFSGLSRARKLKELRQAGVPLHRIEQAMARVAHWFPAEECALTRIEPLSSNAAVRLPDGGLAEIDGQRILDLGDGSPEPVKDGHLLSFQDGRRRNTDTPDPDEWFEIGVRAEDEDNLEEARNAYRQALFDGGPDAEICFNLGNVLYRLGTAAEAVQRYSQAVEIDREYVEAWNNLGVALAASGRPEEAIEALSRAVGIEPRYADAHYNLAEILEQTGRAEEAREHWLAYLREDPDSDVAGEVRRRLEGEHPTGSGK
jgi:tetratricopeptide (TPR) repeat protein